MHRKDMEYLAVAAVLALFTAEVACITIRNFEDQPEWLSGNEQMYHES